MESPISFHLFTVLLMLTSSYGPQPATCTKHGNFTDLEALLAFRANADPHGVLAANWTAGTSFCNWAGVSCGRRRQRVTAIRLRDLPLQGTISPLLGNLSFLSQLYLINLSLTGTIPESIRHLPRLTHLLLEENSVTGLFPPNISSLSYLFLAYNSLSGSFPPNGSFLMPPRLVEISLVGNRLTGDVLSSFVRCPDMEIISIGRNQFDGAIPTEVGSLSKLGGLYLGENRLTGAIPPSLGNLVNLGEVDLGGNDLSGEIPEELGNLTNLRYLNLAGNGNLVGTMPTSLLNISRVYRLDLSVNKLVGSVPAGIGKSLPMLENFNVGDNQLSGGLDFLSSLTNCRSLSYLVISKNAMRGALPGIVGNFSSNLQHFDASENYIKGNIPSALGNLSGLMSLGMNDNELIGTVPSTLARQDSLQYMSLAFNGISGSLPSEIGSMKSLNVLSLKYNILSGPLPESLANATMLQHLHLDNNKFSLSIPKGLWNLTNLLELGLSGNRLNGSLPPQVGNLKALTFLNLSMNMLSGNIPRELGQLSMLVYLDLSKNSFQGQIPMSLGELISATSVNLSCNLLSGSIPKSLANLPYLYSLNLSFNELQGQVPKGRVFLNSSITSLVGNKALCGVPQLHTPPCYNLVRSNSRGKLLSLKYILLITMVGVVLLTFSCLVRAFYLRKKLNSLPDTDLSHLDCHRAISYHELVRATKNFDESNLVGRGGFSSVFRGCLDDGMIVAVKILNLEVEGASKSFDVECQALKMVRHRNLIKVISACSNLEFKALVLEFMPYGSLEQWLYSDNCFLNLIQRLNIMVDVSLALEYLHYRHPQVVLHCDLKPTNILLDEELVAHVSDFGIAKLLRSNSKSIITASVPGTIGYIAPEYATTGTVSRMSDVYSFGILLLETFTRKKSVDPMFGEQSTLREWICKAHPNAMLDVVDKNIIKDHDTSDDLPKLHWCLSSVIELGLLCSRCSPKERIPMTDVVARLQKIKDEIFGGLASS